MAGARHDLGQALARPATRPLRALAALATLVLLAAGSSPAIAQTDHGMTPHHMGASHMGASIMPFDLSRSLHIFTPRPDGGVQDVVSLDHDARQIAIIDGYLQSQAALRDHGDYSAPAAMHGPSMPGLAALSKGTARVRVTFDTLPDGGRIRYTTHDPALVRAVHVWFSAQVHDHQADAMLSHE